MNSLDLNHVNIDTPIGRLEAENILAVEGVRAPVIQWVIDSLRGLVEERDTLLKAQQDLEDLESQVEELVNVVIARDNEIQNLNRLIGSFTGGFWNT
jgi:hypothetical protein